MLVQAFLCVLFGVTVLSAPVENDKIQAQYTLMTPDWLYKHSVITKPFTIYPKYLEIPTGNTFERLIQAELISSNILNATDSVVVTLTIAMDTIIADNYDHDPILGISDGQNFIGFIALDKDNYQSTVPCHQFEGYNSNNILSGRRTDTAGIKVSSREYSGVVTIQIKPNEQWGSCHTEHDEGHVSIAKYYYELDLTKGLYFVMYRGDSGETYRVNYIAAEVHLD